MLSCARSILAEGSGSIAEGGLLVSIKSISRLFRGLLPELCGMFPTRSAMYASNEMAKRMLMNNDYFYYLTTNNNSNTNNSNINNSTNETEHYGTKQETTPIIALSGALSGIAEAIVVTPFQVVKVRLQSKEHLGNYTNSYDCLQKVYRQEGLWAFTNGLSATIGRNSVFNCVYFTVIYQIKQVVPISTTSESKVGRMLHSLGSGFVGGFVATMFNAPFDMVKSRIQAQQSHYYSNGSSSKSGGAVMMRKKVEYTSTLQALVKIAKSEGVLALYKGFTPKALRMATGGAVAVTAFETICDIAHALE